MAANRLLSGKLTSDLRPGNLDFGSLRRLSPISNNYGYDRGTCIDRYYIDKFLARNAEDVKGHVLEFGTDAYTLRFGGSRVTKSDVLDLLGNKKTTIVTDLTRDDNALPDNDFDCVICTQVLPFIYDIRTALKTLYRILKPGGVMLASFPGIAQISHFDWERWGDYWRFTSLSANRLFGEVFPPENYKIEAYGNILAATAYLYGVAAEELTPEELDYRGTYYEVIILVKATKPQTTNCI